MELEDIYRRDLSLLIALQVLVEERSVTLAAKRLHLSQSATSRILARLREMLNDPLFTRVGSQLVPTQFALDSYQQLQQPTSALIQLLTPQQFDPMLCHQSFRIAATDFAMLGLLPFILPTIYQQAPNIKIELVQVRHHELQAQLGVQGIDMAICRNLRPEALVQYQYLGNVGVRCLVAPDHPLADKEMTVADYLAYPHATIAISDGVKALLDDALADYPAREERLRSSQLDCALAMLNQQPLIMTLPDELANIIAQRHRLIAKPLPIVLPALQYSLCWHSRCQTDNAQQWLRQQLSSAAAKLLNQPK